MQGAPAGGGPTAGRLTRQRATVLRGLYRCRDFVSAQQLHAKLATSGAAVGLSTVYRTLRLLERAGRIDVTRDATGQRLYRRRPADGHRHYLMCRHCGLSRAVAADAVERWAERVAETTGFTDVRHTVELDGICDQCRTDPGPRRNSHIPRHS